MSARSAAAVAVWRARRARPVGERAYAVYLGVMVAAVAIAPVARVVWLELTGPAVVTALASDGARTAASLASSGLWCAALAVGRLRGPALRPPVLTRALATSDLSRGDAFRAPVVRSGAVLIASISAVAAGIALVRWQAGEASMLDTAAFVFAGAAVGAIAAMLWLAGQALPRAAGLAAAAVALLGGAGAVLPSLRVFVPSAWVGDAYPGSGSPLAVVPLLVCAALALAVVPSMMGRLGSVALDEQAARWERATAHASSMDAAGAARLYQPHPSTGRRLRAVRAGAPLPLAFLIRDAIGAMRTPGRLLAGVVALAAAGGLLAAAFAPAVPTLAVGAVAGLVAFVGLGPATDGVRHAASMTADTPMYGAGDGTLLAYHSLFPLALALGVMALVALACALLMSLPLLGPLAAAAIAAVLAYAGRVGSALKGPLPSVILTPISTPAGDLSAIVRVVWAVDAILLAAAAGAGAALITTAPAASVAVVIVVAGAAVIRWRLARRR